MPRKLLPILLLALFFTSYLGYYAVYTYELYEIREEVQCEIIAHMPDSEFEKICLEDNRSNIRWEEEGKEFRLHGKMYDVARIKKQNGQTIIYCYNDSKEEKLNAGLSKQIGDETKPGSKHAIPEFQSADWIQPCNLISIDALISFIDKAGLYGLTEDLFSRPRKVTSPPPDRSLVHREVIIQQNKKIGFNYSSTLPEFVFNRKDSQICIPYIPAKGGFSVCRSVLDRKGKAFFSDTEEEEYPPYIATDCTDKIPVNDPVDSGIPACEPRIVSINYAHYKIRPCKTFLYSQLQFSPALGRAPPANHKTAFNLS